MWRRDLSRDPSRSISYLPTTHATSAWRETKYSSLCPQWYSKSPRPSAASIHENVSAQTPSARAERVYSKPVQSVIPTRGSSDHAQDLPQPAHPPPGPACRKSAPLSPPPPEHLPSAPAACADGPNTSW